MTHADQIAITADANWFLFANGEYIDRSHWMGSCLMVACGWNPYLNHVPRECRQWGWFVDWFLHEYPNGLRVAIGPFHKMEIVV